MTAMIEITKLNAWFDDNHVLKDIDISILANGSFGLVGESGSGKSTVLRTITGLVDDWEGNIVVNNKELTKKRDKTLLPSGANGLSGSIRIASPASHD